MYACMRKDNETEMANAPGTTGPGSKKFRLPLSTTSPLPMSTC